VIKRPTESFPPSLPLAVAAPVPELSAADATSAAKTADLHSLVFSLSNRATRRRRIIATAKGGTGTDGRAADSRSNATSEAVVRSLVPSDGWDGPSPSCCCPTVYHRARRELGRGARARPPSLSGDRAFAFHSLVLVQKEIPPLNEIRKKEGRKKKEDDPQSRVSQAVLLRRR